MMPCYKCPMRKACGGLIQDGMAELSCMMRCGECRTKKGECPFACPNNEARFAWMVAEVKRLDYTPTTELLAPAARHLPFFAPQIFHGSRRWKPLQSQLVTISVADLLSRTKPTDEAIRVRRTFRLEDDARIIGLGVAKDHFLERWWGERHQVAARLGQMKLEAVTTPNYSIFTNAPRPQSLVSIARIHHFSEALSAAGVPVIPHVYAETDVDWERWAAVLKEQPRIHTIAIEFQTGLGVESKAHRYIGKLSELRTAIGRSLHLIAVGGTRHSEKLNEVFPHGYTLTDGTSFMKTVRRRRVDHDEPEHRHLDSQDDLSDLLQKNIDSREKRLRRKLRLPPPVLFALAA